MDRRIFICAAAASLVMPIAAMAENAEPATNIVRREHDDQELARASEMARRELKMFRKAVSTSNGSGFMVKAPFKDGGAVEHMWVAVQSMDKQSVNGTVNSEPAAIKNLRIGQPVVVPVSQVEDWMFKDTKGQPRGGFTVPVLLRRQEGK